MIRRYRILVIGIVVVLLVLVTTSVALVTASAGQGPTVGGIGTISLAHQPGTPSVRPTIGGIGMIPTAHQSGAPFVRPTIPGAIPAFTVQDVTDYVNKHGTDWTTPGQVTVTSVEFMTAAQAVAKTHGTLVDTDASRPVCLVTVRGSYGLSAGPPSSGSPTMSGAYLWLDAATGNELELNAIN